MADIPFADYLPEGHEAHAKPNPDIYSEAMREILLPAPAAHLKRFERLDGMIGGLRPYEFTILCGATGTGKTTLAANFSLDLSEQQIPHFIASVETGPTDFLKRKISALAKEDWNTGDPVTVEKCKKFHIEHGGVFEKNIAWLSLYDNRFSVNTLMADISDMVKRKSAQVAIIDNLNFFLEVTSARDSVVEMDRVIHELIIFCKRIPIHLIMIMHPRKTDSGRVENEFDVKGSSTAIQEAHNVILFNRAHPEMIKSGLASESDREILIAKCRRRGGCVRKRIIIQSVAGVSYSEGKVYGF